MTRKFCELSADCLSAPTYLHAEIVASLMLWPDNETARQNYLAPTQFQMLAKMASPDCFDQVLSAALELPPRPELEIRRKGRFLLGMKAGIYLYAAMGAIFWGKPFSMKKNAARIASAWKRVFGEELQGPKDFENRVWPIFRPVSHLWAAYWHSSDGYKPLPPPFDPFPPPFPCRLTDLSQFLELAEGIRRFGEESSVRGRGAEGASRKLLPPDVCIIVPEQMLEIAVPTPRFKLLV